LTDHWKEEIRNDISLSEACRNILRAEHYLELLWEIVLTSTWGIEHIEGSP
jgi:hypothetical protein